MSLFLPGFCSSRRRHLITIARVDAKAVSDGERNAPTPGWHGIAYGAHRSLTRGLEAVAHVEPWTTSFHPGTTTLDRLLELAHEVDFAAFVFAQDDWTTASPPASPVAGSGQASPRDNVVFEAGLFGGALGMRRTFIIHAS